MSVVRRFFVVLFSAFLGLAGSHPLCAGEEEKAGARTVSYYRDIRPIFQRRCQGCHQPAKPSGSFVMTDYASLLKPGDTAQPGVVPEKPEESNLLLMISSDEGVAPAMPKGADPLTPRDVNLIKQWIVEGATDDTPAAAAPSFDVAHPPTYSLPPVLASLDYSPDGQLLAVGGYHEVLLYKSEGSELLARLIGVSPRIDSVRFSPDGKLLAVTGGLPAAFGEVQIWNVADKRLVQSLSITFDTIHGASWSHDGTKLAFGCADNSVRAIEVATGSQILFQGAHSDWVLDTTFSTDSSHLVSVSRDRSMKLTEVATQRFVDNVTSITPGALKGGLICVRRHPTKDELLVGGADGLPKTYQMYRTKVRVIGDDFNLVRAYEAMPGRIFAVAYSPSGDRIVAGSSMDGKGEVRVYQTDDATLLAKFEGQGGPVYAVAFHPDGRRVASAGFDGVVRINEASSGKLLAQFVAAPVQGETVAARAR